MKFQEPGLPEATVTESETEKPSEKNAIENKPNFWRFAENELFGQIIRAVIFGLAWYLLPFWLFIFVAAYLYFSPAFQSLTFFPLFAVLMVLCLWQPASVWFMIVSAIIFGWILFIRGFLFVDRRSAYEMLVITLSFLVAHAVLSMWSAVYGEVMIVFLFPALLIGWLIGSLTKYGNEESATEHKKGRIIFLLSTLVAWQAFVVSAFLPLNQVYQSVIAFLVIAPLVFLLPDHTRSEEPSREKSLLTASTVFVILVMVLASARWSL